MKIAIIVSEFNKKIADRLFAGAEQALKEKNTGFEIFKVPGAFEIPFVAQKLADTKKYSGLVALGCIIKGETDHYRAVCDGVTYGIQKVSVENRIPVMFGVLMCSDVGEAMARSSLVNPKRNKGYECAKALLEIV